MLFPAQRAHGFNPHRNLRVPDSISWKNVKTELRFFDIFTKSEIGLLFSNFQNRVAICAKIGYNKRVECDDGWNSCNARV